MCDYSSKVSLVPADSESPRHPAISHAIEAFQEMLNYLLQLHGVTLDIKT